MSTAVLDSKVGRMYVPRQEVGSIATRKMKVNYQALSSSCHVDDRRLQRTGGLMRRAQRSCSAYS